MTATELKDLFESQLASGTEKVYYMTQDGASASVLSHDIRQASWEDLLVSLAGYTYETTDTGSRVPRWKKD